MAKAVYRCRLCNHLHKLPIQGDVNVSNASEVLSKMIGRSEVQLGPSVKYMLCTCNHDGHAIQLGLAELAGIEF